MLPGMQGGMSQPTPPSLVLDAEQPVRVPPGQLLQTVAPSVFARILRVGAGDPLLSCLPYRCSQTSICKKALALKSKRGRRACPLRPPAT
jgi:hypothetical protein